MRLSLVLPAHNEERLIKGSVRRVDQYLRRIGGSFEIIVGDAGSVDETSARVLELGLPNVRVIREASNGKGRILSACFRECRGDYVGFIDSDLDIDVVYLRPMLDALDRGYDAAIAIKTTEDGQARPLLRRVATMVYNGLVRVLFHSPLSDHQAGCKLFRAEALESALRVCQNTGWLWDTEVLVELMRARKRIFEVPVVARARSDGKVRLGRTSLEMARDLIALYRRKRLESK